MGLCEGREETGRGGHRSSYLTLHQCVPAAAAAAALHDWMSPEADATEGGRQRRKSEGSHDRNREKEEGGRKQRQGTGAQH